MWRIPTPPISLRIKLLEYKSLVDVHIREVVPPMSLMSKDLRDFKTRASVVSIIEGALSRLREGQPNRDEVLILDCT